MDDQEIQAAAARLVMRHGIHAPDFANTVGREMAKVGATGDSRDWLSMAHAAQALLDGMPASLWLADEALSLPTGAHSMRRHAA